MIVFAVESEPTGNYTPTRQELMNAKVLVAAGNVAANFVKATYGAPRAPA